MATIRKSSRAAIYKRDNYACLRCESTEDLTIDHVIPLSKGGANSIDNFQTLCGSCNHSKGNKIADYRLIDATEKAITKKVVPAAKKRKEQSRKEIKIASKIFSKQNILFGHVIYQKTKCKLFGKLIKDIGMGSISGHGVYLYEAFDKKLIVDNEGILIAYNYDTIIRFVDELNIPAKVEPKDYPKNLHANSASNFFEWYNKEPQMDFHY